MIKLRNFQKEKHKILVITILLLLPSVFLLNLINNHNFYNFQNNTLDTKKFKTPEDIQTAAQETFTIGWLENPTFDDLVETVWYSKGEGDTSDVKATAGLGHANLSVMGDQRTFSEISGTPTSDDWLNVSNPAFPALPDFHGIDEYGCEANHTWIDPYDPNQSPSVHWQRNITMPVNMADYVITNASISAVYNASVTTQPGGAGGVNEFYGVDCPGDPVTNPGDYDTVRFYVLVSDLEDNETYEIAWYQSIDLGQDDPEISNITDTLMNTVVEEALIFYLNSLFERDNYNIKVTLGIRIKCVDNFNYDRDRWDSLRIKTCNLTFSYEKKIDQTTSISWNQDGDKISNISNDTIVINEALLNFKYKIDKNWTDASPNSEIRVFIGNNKHTETIKLTNTNTTFQVAKTGGYDVTSLITYNTYINFSIQVYLADEFLLDRNITLSIDDVFLNITYTVTFPDTQSNLRVFFNGINRTLNPLFELPYGTNLNITVKYPDDMGVHISGAIVQLSGNLTGTLMENEILKQYTIIINTYELDIGDINFNIIAHKINYETEIISPIVTILKIRTKNLQLFFNNQNKTSDPVIEIPINKLLNITVKYTDDINNHISGATLLLTGEGILENFIENTSLKHYSLIVNTSIKFIFGANQITIHASKEIYQEMSIDTKITVREINTEIKSTSGSNRININPGESALIRIYINDTDFNETIKDAIVTYSSSLGDGVLLDSDNDGIYEVIIENAPIGTYSIFIHAYGSAIYDFKDYEIILTVIRPVGELILFQLILIGAIVSAIGLGSYFYAYQKILKYPVPVRKVRKYRKSLVKKEAPKVVIMDRERAFKSTYQKEVNTASRYLKNKPTEEVEKRYKLNKKKVENSKTKAATKNVNNNTKSKVENQNKSKQKYLRGQFGIKLRKFRLGNLKTNKHYRFMSILIITILMLSVFILNPSLNQYSNRLFQKSLDSVLLESYDNLGISGQDTFTKQWLNNTSFNDTIEPTWFPTYGGLGDKFDVNATTSPDQANYEILGEKNTFSDISGTPLSSEWTQVHNPEFPLYPDSAIIENYGCEVSHEYNEQADQFPSVHWDRNVTMPVDMSDYIITSASLSAVVNATVRANNGASGGIESPGDATAGNTQNYTWDYVRFYVLLSDLTKEKVYEVAYNQTVDLGKDSAGVTDEMLDTIMTTISEEDLIFYLTSVLTSDFYNFTVTIGMRIWCEDNWLSDRDTWNSLLIKSCNLTFTYERKIDQFTSVSWNQDADKVSDISNETVIVNEARLNFKYKIDKNWTDSSPNSEIKILINDNPHTETIKLSSANTSFQEAKVGGFDVTPLITDDVNLSIQVFLADEFELNQTITISIDNVTLNITYTIIFPDKETDLHLFLNNENKTLDPYFQVNVGEQINITIKYLNKTRNHIPNATVSLSGNFTGTLVENKALEQYSVIINTEISDIGSNFLTITAQALNHEIVKINPIIMVNKFNSKSLQLILNNDNKTLDPNLELIVGEQLNLTVKYTNLLGAHIQGANVLLKSETLTQNLNESNTLKHYTLIINTTEKLKIGVNQLTIEAQESNYETQIINVRVSIRKINVEITTLSGSNKVDRRPGDNANIRIILNNTDFGGYTTGAIVTYVSELGNGILTDSDNDGIYEMSIRDLPDGTFTITITAFAGDQYYIQDLEISLNVFRPEVEFVIFQILMGIGIAVAVLITGYLYAYQKVLKYPKPVRKVRKYRKTLTKENDPGVGIIDRKISFNKIFQKELDKSSKFLKGPPLNGKIIREKLIGNQQTGIKSEK